MLSPDQHPRFDQPNALAGEKRLLLEIPRTLGATALPEYFPSWGARLQAGNLEVPNPYPSNDLRPATEHPVLAAASDDAAEAARQQIDAELAELAAIQHRQRQRELADKLREERQERDERAR